MNDLQKWRGRRFALDPTAYPDLAGHTFEVFDAQYAKGTATAFVATKWAAGRLRWFREDELRPAPAPPEPTREVHMSNEMQIINLAASIAAKNPGLSYADAVKQAGEQLRPVADAWRTSIRDDGTEPAKKAAGTAGPMSTALAVKVQAAMVEGLDQTAALERALAEMPARSGPVLPTKAMTDAAPRKPVALSLSSIVAKPGETFDSLTSRIADEHGIRLREAAHFVGLAQPALAAASP
jgi:hypothetical protein